MTGNQYEKLIRAAGLTLSRAGPFFGHSERQGFRWAAEGPPASVAKMLRLMSALGLSAADVDAMLSKKR